MTLSFLQYKTIEKDFFNSSMFDTKIYFVKRKEIDR